MDYTMYFTQFFNFFVCLGFLLDIKGMSMQSNTNYSWSQNVIHNYGDEDTLFT